MNCWTGICRGRAAPSTQLSVPSKDFSARFVSGSGIRASSYLLGRRGKSRPPSVGEISARLRIRRLFLSLRLSLGLDTRVIRGRRAELLLPDEPLVASLRLWRSLHRTTLFLLAKSVCNGLRERAERLLNLVLISALVCSRVLRPYALRLSVGR
jgi:hypothetical protein